MRLRSLRRGAGFERSRFERASASRAEMRWYATNHPDVAVAGLPDTDERLGADAQHHKALGRYQQLLWQDQHGLPQNGVLAILRTRDGYLWLGTIEGAARFDGVRFVVFDNNNTPQIQEQPDSVPGRRSRRKSLAGRRERRADTLHGRAFPAVHDRDGLSSDFVRCLLADRAGNRLDRHARRRTESFPERTLHGLHHARWTAERSDSDARGRRERRSLDRHKQRPGPVRAGPLHRLHHA